MKYQTSSIYGSKDIAQVSFSKLGKNSISRSKGQMSWYQKKGFFIMHLYLKYKSFSTYDSKDISQVKGFQN
jgi:hypothetical protein